MPAGDLLKWFPRPIVFFLKVLKKVRRFDKSFRVYIPDVNNSREVLLWKLKVINPLLGTDVNFNAVNQSSEPIDICIPAVKKDIESLGVVIKSARQYIHHPINKIHVICKLSDEISAICRENDAVMVDEVSVLGYDKSRINYSFKGEDRAGWLYQQLLKLNCDTVAETDNFLVLDADTVFVKPKIFRYKGKTIFDMSEERHEPYHEVYKKLLERPTTSELSFISHHMLFNKTLLKELKAEIEAIHHKKWDEAILENTDYSSISGFSEYELYGNFVSERYPQSVKKEYWFNSTSPVNPPYIKTVSMHAYLRENNQA